MAASTTDMAETKIKIVGGLDAWVAPFEPLEQGTLDGQPSWLLPLRKAGLARFAENGFPTLKDEDWRFTNVAPIAKLPFQPVLKPHDSGLAVNDLAQFPFADLQGSRLVFVNGHFAPALSSIRPQPDGVRVGSLAAGLRETPDLLSQHLTQYTAEDVSTFAALNIAYFLDGAFIHVPAGRAAAGPVHLLYVNTATEAGVSPHTRNLVLAGADSQLTVIESFVSIGDAATFTNAVTEFQDESTQAWHIAGLYARLGRECNFLSHSIALGARLSRNSIRTKLDGEGLECVLNGLYLTRGEQLADHYMIVEHAQPRCESHEYFNGILEDKSRGVFHGRIYVHPIAQKTDAKQTNKNLLLSDEARADTKPQLEIYADDVKCTHGATIGQLNDDSIYYLRTRGIGEETARRMLIHAFAGEIIDRIRCDDVREELDQLVWDRLEQSERVAVAK
jgi:Fe-S cluster assembly protein SufD